MEQVTASIGNQQYETTLSFGKHTLIADEPETLNGTDKGPTPDTLLMMSLASCTAITLRMYANRKNYSLEQIKVHITLEKTADKTVFTRNLEFIGNLAFEEEQRLVQIAKACPVHKILTQPIEINTQVIKP